MADRRSSLEQAILDMMAQVRGARIHQETAGSVDAELNALCERAGHAAASPSVLMALEKAEAAFLEGDTTAAVQCLSRALMEISRTPPSRSNIRNP